MRDGIALPLSPQQKYIRLLAKDLPSENIMQPMPGPNRLGLGMRPPLPSYGQGPSMSALAQQQQMHHQPFMPLPPPAAQKQTTLFVGSISGGITDAFLNALLSVSRLHSARSPN
jgi:hypothetical protein